MKLFGLLKAEKDSYDLDDLRYIIAGPKGWFSRLIWRFISLRLIMVDTMIARLWSETNLETQRQIFSLPMPEEPRKTSVGGGT